ncbi:DUF4136 domain-containing protein [Hymenobacter cheonanensis]|uniref:DUF4136 domain-containing protein n=1 Tax=Hymenobacter sp. CA2-7 TaxID=3063993 RepID=UPI0027135282|nr:DUF4136 domain-containing protein [Hymenobacter sp. CA2-7]MDO7887617.1 DUF4136 domain-containing protein [Hymenobacter sp. CA2-7]
MKLTSTIQLICLLSLGLLSSCLTSRDARIESSYSYRGRFRHYRTYGFLSGNGLAADSTRLSESLRDAIKQRLRLQGYKYSRRNPDLMVSYKLFEGDMRFPGFVQEDITRWVKNNEAENEETPEEQRHAYQPTRLLMLDGTLMVTLIDTKTDNAIWNGYASGVTVPEGIRGEYVLVRSVRSIFDRYRIFTENYFNGGNLDGAMNGEPTGEPGAPSVAPPPTETPR